jgi:hypothetical protein
MYKIYMYIFIIKLLTKIPEHLKRSINLTQDVKDLYNENYKALKKEIVIWKDLRCS